MRRELSYRLVPFFILKNGLETVAQNENQCQDSTCQNGGTCVDGVNDYTCLCKQTTVVVPDNGGNRTYITGYSGRHCEHDIDECILPICLNGGICRNEIGSYTCLCSMDRNGYFYSGLNCEKVTSYCEVSADVVDDQPACKNNGTCEPQPTGYLCHCLSGFTGNRCRINIDECSSNPCKNNNTCFDGINGYTCSCSYGTTGTNCEMDICSPNPCLNGGVCHVGKSSGFVCDCTGTNFIGKYCEILVVADDKNGAIQHDIFWYLIVLNTIAMPLMNF